MTQLRTRILASFGVALLVVVTGWVGTATVGVSVTTRDHLNRIRERAEARSVIEQEVLRARTAVLGYLVTGDPRCLPPYQRLLDDAAPATRLVAQLADPRAEQADVAELRAALADERATLADTMRLLDDGDHDGAIALVRGETARNGLGRIHDCLDRITREDTEDRQHLRVRLDHALHAGRVVVLGGSLIAFVLAVLVNLALLRSIRDREAAQQLVVTQAEQLQRSNEELDRFAYATSHDLKAPLRGVMNIVDWVEEDLGDKASPDVKRNLGLLRGRARRLEALIDGILSYSRAGRVHDKPAVVDVHALAAEIAELIAPPAGCEVAIEALPRLVTERVPLQQVLMNLTQNAVKHGCPGGHGRIEIGAEPAAPGMWRFSVRDDGPGIAPQFHERIFGIFQSLAPRDVVEGTGIGLAMVKRLVESRGGEVGVESMPGEGARFVFTWPGELAA